MCLSSILTGVSPAPRGDAVDVVRVPEGDAGRRLQGRQRPARVPAGEPDQVVRSASLVELHLAAQPADIRDGPAEQAFDVGVGRAA